MGLAVRKQILVLAVELVLVPEVEAAAARTWTLMK
jgi:hypothetical protein